MNLKDVVVVVYNPNRAGVRFGVPIAFLPGVAIAALQNKRSKIYYRFVKVVSRM